MGQGGPLPSSGPLSISMIREKLTGTATSGSTTSLKDAETGVYSTINQNSPSKPDEASPYAVSEWYSYDHLYEPAPTDPSNVIVLEGTVNGNVSDVQVTWTDNSNNETGFRIEAGTTTSSTTLPSTWTYWTTTGANITSYVRTNQPNGGNCWYHVRVRANGSCADSGWAYGVGLISGNV